MKPETGDPNARLTANDIAAALHGVGVVSGDTVMFHSSLSSMGNVVGGAPTVIEGFLEAVGPSGTVAVPTLCNWDADEQHLVFGRWDPRTTSCYVGTIPETFRQDRRACRSDHPTHSVAAIGARARELTAGHGLAGLRLGPFGEAAFARESPWQRLVDWNAAYCFVGVDFRVNTMVHLVESLIVERTLARCRPESRGRPAERVIGWMRPGVWPSIRIEDRAAYENTLAERGLVRYGKIGSATLRCARARPMVEEWVALIEADPARWLPEEFRRWLAECEACCS